MRSRRTQAAPSSKHSEEFFFHNVTFFFALFPQVPRNNLTSSKWQQQSRGEARETNLQLTFHNYQVFLLFFFFLKTRFVATTSTTSICGSLSSPILVQFLVRHRTCTVEKKKKVFTCMDTIMYVHGNHANGSPHIRAGVKIPIPLIMADDSNLLFTSCIFF